MAAYLIGQGTHAVPEKLKAYRDAVVPLIEKYQGKYVIRRGALEVLEGKHDGRTITIHEFPSMEALRAFWNSEEYAKVKELRRGIVELDFWAVEGV